MVVGCEGEVAGASNDVTANEGCRQQGDATVATLDARVNLVGQPIKRRAPQLMTRPASFLDGIKLQGLAHARIQPSPCAYARIVSIDTSWAAAMSGVVGLFTHDDFADLNRLPGAWQAGSERNNVDTLGVAAVDEELPMEVDAIEVGGGSSAIDRSRRRWSTSPSGLQDWAADDPPARTHGRLQRPQRERR